MFGWLNLTPVPVYFFPKATFVDFYLVCVFIKMSSIRTPNLNSWTWALYYSIFFVWLGFFFFFNNGYWSIVTVELDREWKRKQYLYLTTFGKFFATLWHFSFSSSSIVSRTEEKLCFLHVSILWWRSNYFWSYAFSERCATL